MRAVLAGETPGAGMYAAPFLLNLVFFGLGVLFFRWVYEKALVSGRLVRIGME